MTGPDHYQEAERLLVAAVDTASTTAAASWVAEAQVHATLALTAATARRWVPGGTPIADWEAWEATAGVPEGESAPPGDAEPYQTAKWMMRPDLQHPHRARKALRAFVDHLNATDQPDPHPHVIDALNSALLAYDPADGSES